MSNQKLLKAERHGHSCHENIIEETLHHIPYAISSVALSIICLTFLSVIPSETGHHGVHHRLFHSFHFLHLLFAGTGTVLTFRRYSKNIFLGLIIGITVPVIFCSLSDALLPFLGGWLLNLDMSFHWCFIHHIGTVVPFLGVGIINGWVMSSHKSQQQIFYSVGFHFAHIFISAMASILYLVSFGFSHWWNSMGFVFLYMIVAVLVPCTLADIIVPILFANVSSSHSKKKDSCS